MIGKLEKGADLFKWLSWKGGLGEQLKKIQSTAGHSLVIDVLNNYLGVSEASLTAITQELEQPKADFEKLNLYMPNFK